jgi:hypothetical protein
VQGGQRGQKRLSTELGEFKQKSTSPAVGHAPPWASQLSLAHTPMRNITHGITCSAGAQELGQLCTTAHLSVPEALSTALAPAPSPCQVGTEPAAPVGSWTNPLRWPRETLRACMAGPAIPSPPSASSQGEARLGCYTQQELESYAGLLPASIVGTGWDSVFSTRASVKRTQRPLLLKAWSHLLELQMSQG